MQNPVRVQCALLYAPEFSVYCEIYISDIAAFSGIVAHEDSTRLVYNPAAALSQVKAQYAEVARQVASGASGPFVDSASQGIVHGGGGQALGANAVALLLVPCEHEHVLLDARTTTLQRSAPLPLCRLPTRHSEFCVI